MVRLSVAAASLSLCACATMPADGAGTRSISYETGACFGAWLEPLRPRSGSVRYDGPPLCGRMATDLPSADVTWRMRDGSVPELYFYYGCDMEGKRAMAERLRKAPGLLPIGAFIRAER
ncbi:MAG: hypothetical protein JWO81_1246 [Alphaproteobacteria bacterium]|nr:hypothetical protein [Alphaproteobacteria bacterium]